MRRDLISALFDCHTNTITNWKKEGKPSLLLVERYFKEDDIEEFLKYGSIKRLESLDGSIDSSFKDELFKLLFESLSQKLTLFNTVNEVNSYLAIYLIFKKIDISNLFTKECKNSIKEYRSSLRQAFIKALMLEGGISKATLDLIDRFIFEELLNLDDLLLLYFEELFRDSKILEDTLNRCEIDDIYLFYRKHKFLLQRSGYGWSSEALIKELKAEGFEIEGDIVILGERMLKERSFK